MPPPIGAAARPAVSKPGCFPIRSIAPGRTSIWRSRRDNRAGPPAPVLLLPDPAPHAGRRWPQGARPQTRCARRAGRGHTLQEFAHPAALSGGPFENEAVAASPPPAEEAEVSVVSVAARRHAGAVERLLR